VHRVPDIVDLVLLLRRLPQRFAEVGIEASVGRVSDCHGNLPFQTLICLYAAPS
jgi:hypothetical protein